MEESGLSGAGRRYYGDLGEETVCYSRRERTGGIKIAEGTQGTPTDLLQTFNTIGVSVGKTGHVKFAEGTQRTDLKY